MVALKTLCLLGATLGSSLVSATQNKNVSYTNPVLSGWNSDPSCVFVAELDNTTFCTTSSFIAFPGAPVYASKDLINWKLASNVVNRPEQLPTLQTSNNIQGGGIFASTLRYHNSTFYLITTYIESPLPPTFYIFTSKDATNDSAWSIPFAIETPYIIDPDIFFDDDDTVVVAYAGHPIKAQIIDLKTGNATEVFDMWNGTGNGFTEGPHIYKKDGYYYLLIAEGGTELGHSAAIARSKSLRGPYESSPTNPLVSNRRTNEYFQSVGHADLFEDAYGNWWGCALGVRGGPQLYNQTVFPMGREMVLFPMTWPKGGWPIASQVRGRMTGPLPPPTLNVSGEGLFAGGADVVDFVPGSSFPKHFDFWRTPAKPESFTISPKNKPNTLRLTASRANITGPADSNATDGLTLIMRRQTQTLFNFTVDVELLGSKAQDGDEVGVTSFLDQYQHVDLGVVYLAKNKKVSPYLRFRATAFGKTNFTGVVPETKIVALPSDWSNDLVRLDISTINATFFSFAAAPASRPSCQIVVGVANTTIVSGPGNASGKFMSHVEMESKTNQ
jgi:beta-xylosidase